MLTNNSSNQKYNTIKQAINPATLLIGSIGLSRDISINSTFLNSQGQHLDSPNPTLSIPSNSSSSPPSKPQFNPVNHAQRVPQQVVWRHYVRDRTKRFRFFLKYVPTVLVFSRPSAIKCKKPFFEIRPGTRFFVVISILVPMGLYMDQNRNNNERACSRSNFEKRFFAFDCWGEYCGLENTNTRCT